MRSITNGRVRKLNKNYTGAITGFIKLGDINTHLEKPVKDDDNSQTPNLAKSMLIFLVKGLK